MSPLNQTLAGRWRIEALRKSDSKGKFARLRKKTAVVDGLARCGTPVAAFTPIKHDQAFFCLEWQFSRCRNTAVCRLSGHIKTESQIIFVHLKHPLLKFSIMGMLQSEANHFC
jgi:hypothetical protein